MQKRLLLLLGAILVIIMLLIYPSTQCRVTASELAASSLKAFVIPVQEGYAVGFSFNVTNQAKCEVNAQKIHVVLRDATYADGRQVAQNAEEREDVSGTLAPGESGSFSHTFDSYFAFRPAKLLLRVEMTFAETGPVVIFDGELPIPI
jgi:hypothetical protein